MSRRAKKYLANALRAAICVAALWLVVRGVTYYDRVRLVDGREIVGAVLPNQAADGLAVRVSRVPSGEPDGAQDDPVFVLGSITVVEPEHIAKDADGAYLVTYGLRTAWLGSHKWLLLLAVLVHFPVVFPQALRFYWLLRAQRIAVSYWECVKLSFAGNFLNFATPLGSHAGDAFKAYFASLHTDRKTEAVTTVVLDRVIGLGTLLLVAAIITLLASSEGKLAVLRPYVLGLLAVAVTGLVAYFAILGRWRVPEAWSAKIPALAHVGRIDQAARQLAARRGVLISAVLLTAFLQFLALAAYCAVARAMNLSTSGNILEFFAYFYAGTLVQALPGPPQGLGTVELVYRYFFGPYGSPSQIVSMALAIRVVVLICALPGLLVTLTGGYRPKAAGVDSDALSQAATDAPDSHTAAAIH